MNKSFSKKKKKKKNLLKHEKFMACMKFPKRISSKWNKIEYLTWIPNPSSSW